MLKKSTNNTFDKGLLMDFNPIVTPNNVLTNCLNGTIITFNGNEYALQNDMGNGRVETAYLPEGYIPMGTAELGGIIYIVSYNPLTDRCQIGSFPSPERNISSDESPTSTNLVLSTKDFYLHWDEDEQHNTPLYNRIIKSTTQKLTLTTSNLYPGDKFQISSPDISDARQYLSAYNNYEENADLDPRYLKFSIISIDDSGNINNMNSDLIWSTSGQSSGAGKYYIREDEISDSNGNVTLDEYRTLVNSNYNIFQGLTAGKLGVLAELECIDTFNVSYYIQTKQKTSDTGENMTHYTVYLLLNWSYNNSINRNPINLYGVKLSGTVVSDYYPMGYSTINKTLLFDKYPQYINAESSNLSNTDILKNKDVTFANPKYYSITEFIEKYNIWEDPDNDKQDKYDDTKYPYYKNPTEPRQNDGSDNQYIIKAAQIAVKQGSTGTIHLEVSPCMPFGVIDYLKQSFTIDLEKIGSGEFNLNKYQYYNTNETWTIDLGFENYPEEGHEFRDLTASFYELNDTIYKQLIKGTTNSYEYNGGSVFDNCNTIKRDGQEEIWANKKEPLPNNIKCDLTLTDPALEYKISGVINGNYTIQTNALSKTNVYLVKINFGDYNNRDNSSDSFSYYRLFYSSDIFNNKTDILDYGQIVLNDNLQLSVDIDANITSRVSEPDGILHNYNLNEQTSIIKGKHYNIVIDNIKYSYTLNTNKSLNPTLDSSSHSIELQNISISNCEAYTHGNSIDENPEPPQYVQEGSCIECPFLYILNNSYPFETAGTFDPLSIGKCYLNFSGDKNNLYIGFCDAKVDDNVEGYRVSNVSSDPVPFDSITSLNVVSDLLNNNDVVMVYVYSRRNDDKVDAQKYRVSVQKSIYTTEMYDPVDCVFEMDHGYTFMLLLAFKDIKDKVHMFSIANNNQIGKIYSFLNSADMRGEALMSTVTVGDFDDSNSTFMSNTTWDSEDYDTEYKKLFKPFYKIDITDKQNFEVYGASVRYWDNIACSIQLKYSFNIILSSIKLNDNTIEVGKELNIKNLYYVQDHPLENTTTIEKSIPALTADGMKDLATPQEKYKIYMKDLSGEITYYSSDYINKLFGTGNINEQTNSPYIVNQEVYRVPSHLSEDIGEYANINDWKYIDNLKCSIRDGYLRVDVVTMETTGGEIKPKFPTTNLSVQSEKSNTDGQRATLYINTIYSE